VTYAGELVTGYKDLPRADPSRLRPGATEHWDALYRGVPIRIAAQARRVYGKPEPVLVEVAETTNARRALERRLLLGLAGLEAGLIGLMALLAWHAVGRGLEPLAALSRDIDAQAVRGAAKLRPLDLTAVPSETLAPAVAFNSMIERLDRAIGLVRRFTADASHQMRTPLAILRTHLDLVRRHGSDTPEGCAALADIDGAIRRLERLLAQLLALARADEDMELGSLSETADLAQVAAEVLSERVPQALEKDIEVQFERPDDPVPIKGSALLISEIAANLIDNAIRYNGRGGTLAVRVLADRHHARIEIEDSGPGIPAAERARVFERFYRIPRKGAPEGSGLGLAIVRALADRLGAEIKLSDRAQGPGLIATVEFRKA
jgi:two-component system sensor histidine kinase TctE